MSLRLYASWFSTFARKVALGLELKALQYEPVDALTRDFRPELKRLNPRVEVPVLLDDGLIVINSSDILQYLDWRYPTPSLYPESISERVTARALERLADEHFDPIVVDCSFWKWAERDDLPPPGLIETGQKDIDNTLMLLETELVKRPKPWPFGTPGLVECAWFPNLAAVRPLGFSIEPAKTPTVLEWLSAMRRHPVFINDARRTREFMKTLANSNHERRRLFWSGDRIEWLFSRGYHEWLYKEIAGGRTVFPG
jgi:glutathione S-transferase